MKSFNLRCHDLQCEDLQIARPWTRDYGFRGNWSRKRVRACIFYVRTYRKFKKKTTSKRFLSLFVGFLELINNMLTSGMVPALFPDDEKETIIGQVKSTILIHHSQDGTSC